MIQHSLLKAFAMGQNLSGGVANGATTQNFLLFQNNYIWHGTGLRRQFGCGASL